MGTIAFSELKYGPFRHSYPDRLNRIALLACPLLFCFAD